MVDFPDTEQELRDELARLQKINDALIARALAEEEIAHTDFGIFKSTILLEDQIRGRTLALNHALREIEERNRALRESRAELRAIFDLMPTPLVVTRPGDGMILEVSRSYAEFFGLPADALIGRLTHPDDLRMWNRPEDRTRFLRELEAGGGLIRDFRFDTLRADGSIVNLLVSGRIVTIDERQILIKEFHDVTETTRKADRLRTLAERDVLTGLPNRRAVLNCLERALAAASSNRTLLAIGYVDLDGFKSINDRFGHQTGDHVLTEIAQRLTQVFRTSDIVGRLGGDEFAVLLPDVANLNECEAVLSRAIESVQFPLRSLPGQETRITATIGYTIFPKDYATAEVLLDHADQALYEAKKAGKNRTTLYRAPPEALDGDQAQMSEAPPPTEFNPP